MSGKTQGFKSIATLADFVPKFIRTHFEHIPLERSNPLFVQLITEEVFYFVLGFNLVRKSIQSMLLSCNCISRANPLECLNCSRSFDPKVCCPQDKLIDFEDLKRAIELIDIKQCLKDAELGDLIDISILRGLTSFRWTETHVLLSQSRLEPYLHFGNHFDEIVSHLQNRLRELNKPLASYI